ncbi:hypothetical protein [Nonomuraea sp. NPDC050643]|uniref:hypothetical protein n=1 Tax=Nonomuraea sp. NPDC050643 TaxID=3155660 RepID=UPI0033E9D2A3
MLRALDVLETSRSAWRAEMDDFAARRRVEKRRHRRSLIKADRLRFHDLRWPAAVSAGCTD